MIRFNFIVIAQSTSTETTKCSLASNQKCKIAKRKQKRRGTHLDRLTTDTQRYALVQTHNTHTHMYTFGQIQSTHTHTHTQTHRHTDTQTHTHPASQHT